jgi:hypothetical protein
MHNFLFFQSFDGGIWQLDLHSLFTVLVTVAAFGERDGEGVRAFFFPAAWSLFWRYA